jgi:hypothetical protein
MRLGRLLAVAGLAAAFALSAASQSSPASVATAVGHRLSIAVPRGWSVTYRRFTPCSDPVERFSLLSGHGQILMIQERLHPIRAELGQRPVHFAVSGRARPLECCSLDRPGWVIQFGDHGRGFYAFLYPGRGSAQPLLRALDSFSVV